MIATEVKIRTQARSWSRTRRDIGSCRMLLAVDQRPRSAAPDPDILLTRKLPWTCPPTTRESSWRSTLAEYLVRVFWGRDMLSRATAEIQGDPQPRRVSDGKQCHRFRLQQMQISKPEPQCTHCTACSVNVLEGLQQSVDVSG